MKKLSVIILTLLLCTTLLTGCGENGELQRIAPTSPIGTTDGTASTTTTATQEITTTTTSMATTTTKTPVKATTTKKQTTATKTTCCRRYPEDGGLCIIPGWNERKPGVENRFVTTGRGECTEKRPVLYKCPECLGVALYEYLNPLGHDFSGEETVARYPTVGQEGSYEKMCQRQFCCERILTTPIPKRTGDYSTIDPCFKVKISGGEWYEIENLNVHIIDERTWGSVPTITYNAEGNHGEISFLLKDGTPVTHSFTIDLELISQGYSYYGNIVETGQYESKYSRLSINGTAN